MPSNLARRVVDELQKYGEVRRDSSAYQTNRTVRVVRVVRIVSFTASRGWAGSPTKDLSLNPPLHVLPRLQRDRSGFDRRNASLNFDGPRSVGTRVRWAVEACQQFSVFGHSR